MKLVHIFWLGCLIVLLLILGGSAALVTIATVSNDRNVRNVATQNEQVAKDRAALVTKYSSCLQTNNLRMRSRTFVGDTLSILFHVLDPDPTPEAAALGERARAMVKARGEQIYPGTDCTKFKPAHMTRAEKASLFTPVPIPPLDLVP